MLSGMHFVPNMGGQQSLGTQMSVSEEFSVFLVAVVV